MREKLIELLNNSFDEQYSKRGLLTAPHTADDLIANGVTIQKEGVWVGEADGYADGELVYDVWYCSECNYCIDDGTDDPDLLPNYCQNCGAKLSKPPKGE
ncbi:MAG: hypothetical protein J6Q92_05070 [Oscillospiraceae bacterium]|nr:hypothetical protein [Oscillospiraceae bacterium]